METNTGTTASGPKYAVKVQLVGEDGNAFAILGRVSRALKSHLREQGNSPAEVKAIADQFMSEATSGDYDHLLRTCMEWVDAH